jgi:hypothetical protein
MSELSIAVQKFNDKVRAMNQRRGKELILTAEEARSLHSDIFNILAQVSSLAVQVQENKEPETISIEMDGGSWN